MKPRIKAIKEPRMISLGSKVPCASEEIGSTNDVVNKPLHYNTGKIECIDAIEAATVGKTGLEAVCVGNVMKYIWRYENKNGVEDLKKARWYLDRCIQYLEEKETN